MAQRKGSDEIGNKFLQSLLHGFSSTLDQTRGAYKMMLKQQIPVARPWTTSPYSKAVFSETKPLSYLFLTRSLENRAEFASALVKVREESSSGNAKPGFPTGACKRPLERFAVCDAIPCSL
jgi:hypothetical protein